METYTYFGITIDHADMDVDYQDLFARLFLCPSITCDHVSYFISQLNNGEISWGKVIEFAKYEIAEFFDSDEAVDTDKTKEWEKRFSPLTEKDFKYLLDTYSVKKESLGIEKRWKMDFDSPKDLAAAVKQYIKGQDEVIDKLAVLFYLHYISRIKGTDSFIRSALTIGPTGCGKSEINRRFGLLCDFPVLTVNSGQISPTGYKGSSLSERVLQFKADKGLSDEDMKYLVIILTEVDKIAHYNLKTCDSGYDADQMLQIMQLLDKGNQMSFESQTLLALGSGQSHKLCTDNWLIVLDGAFAGMEEIVRRRLNLNRSLGYSKPIDTSVETANVLKHVNNMDLLKWGFTQELVGRIDEICVVNPMTKDVIYQILSEAKDSILQYHINLCKQFNIDLQFTDEALWFIANDAMKKPFGFREVPSSLSDIMIPIYREYCRTSNSNEKQTIVIDKEHVARQLKTR